MQHAAGSARRTIVIVNDFCHVNGGAAQVALTSAIALARAGERVIVFGAVDPVMPELAASGIEVLSTHQEESLRDSNRLRAAAQGIWNTKAQRIMDTLLARLDPGSTIVHLHGWVKALSSAVVRVAARRGFAIVCTLHDYFAACPNGGFFDYQQSVICDERALSAGCVRRDCDARSYRHKLWRVARHHVQRRVGGVPDAIGDFIAVSALSERVLRPYLSPTARVHRIGNPITVEHAPTADPAARDSFVFAGRLSREKGVLLLAEAARLAAVPVVFVGDGPLREEIVRTNPDARITGWLPHRDVIGELRSGRALVAPSLLYETQGLAVLEAAAVGVPAIVADTSAASDSVTDGVTGLWFRSGDVDALAGRLRSLADPGVTRRLGQAAYNAYWATPHTMAHHIRALQQCYATMLAEPIRRAS